MLKAATESNAETFIDEELLQQEGIGYDKQNDIYFDLNTGEIIDLQYIEERLQAIMAEERQEDQLSHVMSQKNLDTKSRA
jgi:hypothetical protein